MFKKVIFIILIVLAFCSFSLITENVVPVAAQNNVITLRGDITKNMTLTPANRYVLEGGVFVRAGATLKIKAGTQIFAGPRSFLVIDRGAKIIAKGKPAKPIVFTSAQDLGNRKRGDWGGLIINGFAPINNGDAKGEADGEGNTGKYGGSNANDNSGILRYVRIEFAGFPLTPTNELNGVALQGVGRGTEIDYIQVTESGDDAIEFFGGTVNVKHLLLYGAMDDAFDWTGGWQGKAQFVL
ncbi:MAG: putative lipoprotein, partial [bacterium]